VGAGSSAAASGVVFGLAIAFLGQQLGFLDLSPLVSGLVTVLLYAVVFGLVFGAIGAILGRRYLKRHMTPAAKTTTTANDSSGAPAPGSSGTPPATQAGPPN
jgi:NhaP-type Na+/H+ or K+/H+ antiporter